MDESLDIEYWEAVAYVWLADAEDKNYAWQRFCEAYPEHAHEDREKLWGRVLKSEWHRRHHHHHHPYDHHDRDED